MPEANVRIILAGLQLLFVDPKNKKCTVGVLRDAPQGHEFSIKVFQPDATGELQPVAHLTEADIKNNLQISVSNTSKTGISRRKMDLDIDRLGGPSDQNLDSFRWVVDFERELYQKPIGAKKAGFVSFLSLNNGELFANFLSKNKLKTKKLADVDFEEFGHVATQTGIDIVLDQPKSKAVFKNGNQTIFTADRTSSFRVLIERVCSGQTEGANADANAYFTAIGDLLSDEEKIIFSATPLQTATIDPNTPEDAACLGGNMSRSQPGP
jgi:hypothetical protein